MGIWNLEISETHTHKSLGGYADTLEEMHAAHDEFMKDAADGTMFEFRYWYDPQTVCHCGRTIQPRNPDPWEGRLNDYCSYCASVRCDAYPDACLAHGLSATD